MKELINTLKKLKKIGVVAVKQSLEDEGASFRDIKIMRKITKAAKIKTLNRTISRAFEFELDWLKYQLVVNKKDKLVSRNHFFRIREIKNRQKILS